MEDMLTTVGKNFSFVEIMCFCLLWRIENTLKGTTDAINKHLDAEDKALAALMATAERIESKIDAMKKG